MAITHSVKFTASAKAAISEIEKYEDKIVATAQTVDKYATSLGGGKILASANNWVAAVDKIGGATKLTGVEQEKVNKVLDQAIAKYTALGKTAPTAMTDLYEATKKVPDALEKSQAGAGGLMSKLGPLGPMIATTFSVGAVLGFGKALLDTADATVKMADKTGMSIEAVQRLGYIASQSGNTLDQVSGAVSMLQKRLAEGEDSAVGAMKQLGIEHERFMAMSPDQQFMTVARAVKDIEDPMQRVKVATELFGRAGAEMLPTLIADVDALGAAAPVMSERATKAFDSIGDSISRLTSKMKVMVGEGLASGMDAYGRLAQGTGQVFSGQFSKAATTLLDLETEMPRVATQAKDLSVATTSVALSMEDADRAGKDLADTFRDNRTATTAAESATKKAADAFAKLKTDIYEVEKVGAGASLEVYRFGRVLDEAGDTATVVKNLEELRAKLYEIEKIGAGAGLEVYKFGQVLDEAGDATKVVTDQQNTASASADKSAKRWAMLGDVFSEVSRAAEMAGNTTTAAVFSIGSAIAKAAPGGPWAMALAGGMAVFSTISGALFKTEGRKVNDLRDAYIGAAGGFAALNEKARAAGTSLSGLLNAKTVQDYEAAVAALNGKLEKTAELQGELAGLQSTLAGRQVMDWKAAEEVITRYGGSVETLGQQFVQAKSTASWKDIIDDFETLRDMGGDVGGVLSTMSDEISTLVQTSLRMGTEIPENMRPYIEELIRAGLLVDANGDKITDLTSLKFGAALVSEVDKIIAAIEKLILTLEQGLTGAFQTVGNVRVPPITIPYSYEPTNGPPGRVDPELPSYAEGTGGFVNFGRGTLAMLHGYEAVVPRGQAGPGGSSAPTIIHNYIHLDGREVARNQIRYIPGLLTAVGK